MVCVGMKGLAVYRLYPLLPVAGLLLAGAAAAQPATGAPTREEIDPSRRPSFTQPSRLVVDGDIERGPCALADPAYATIKLRITRGRGPGNSIGWRLAGTLELRQGVDILGASPSCLAQPAACNAVGVVPPALVNASPTATVLRATALAEWRFARRASLVVQPRAQWASGAVFGFERFALGNYTVGRGYEAGLLTGDDGAAVSAELRLDPLLLSSSLKLSAQPFAFVDAGWAWTRGLGPLVANPNSLVSAGGGARVSLSSRARLDLTGAVALKGAGPVQAGDARLLLTLTTRLLPWRTR